MSAFNLQREISEVTSKTTMLGVQLGFELGDLHQLETEQMSPTTKPEQCLLQMLTEWRDIDKLKKEKIWNDVYDALESLQNRRLVHELKQKGEDICTECYLVAFIHNYNNYSYS